MLTVGIDVGSITAKAAVVRDGALISDKLILTGFNARHAGEQVFDTIIDDLGIEASSIDKIISTGYGRNSVAIADRGHGDYLPCNGGSPPESCGSIGDRYRGTGQQSHCD